tara:strand:+ start:6088 stop:7044 length:957 start_codon:yes stop_codon:yes gene_type:complete
VRYIIYGAGAIGGAIGAQLFQQGQDVILIARGAHYRSIAEKGLRYINPEKNSTLKIPVVSHPAELSFTDEDIIFLTVKSQHTAQIMIDLSTSADPKIPIVCCQNGVANEAIALRFFDNVYCMLVMVGGTHLNPGEVIHHSARPGGVLDCGRYPNGIDEIIKTIATDLTKAGFVSRPNVNAMGFKYTKLVMNLGNALQALCGGNISELLEKARNEALLCLKAANLKLVDLDLEGTEDKNTAKLPATMRGGGSSWQSLQRGAADIETDYLNGEICRLGRIHGIPTPVNKAIQILASRAIKQGWQTGTLPAEDIHTLSTEY